MAKEKMKPGLALPTIHTVRKQKVVLDSDLANLYGVPTFQLNQAVKRNTDRFPPDFSFVITREEFANLRSQTVISSSDTEDDLISQSAISKPASR